ncbi:hypothetical protein GALMADRAFT_206263 [Galerina marginata CBS 339.88]|uniref:DUF6593 domain-containing protein n=1 Tax=Galerina marginata (strain CBS 339.88) TaxID=685588 RepID=A0A067TGV5_GALM3|nr:hypothetical protein GALMADRAFT_206263 [Galerina marginata CBS 339.88]
MHGQRPPSYRTAVDSHSPSATQLFTSSSWLSDDIFTGTPSETSSRDPESILEDQLHNRPRMGPISLETAPEVLSQRSPISPLSMTPARLLPTEKRRPIFIQPSENISYAFSMGPNSMELTRIADAEEHHPLYSITIQVNYFMPLSFITRVHRFPNDKIGEFEMGITTVPSTVKIGSHTELVSNILSKSGSRNSLLTAKLVSQASWFWNPLVAGAKYCLKWEYDKRPCICRSTGYKEKPILAHFTSPFGFNSSSEVALLEVTPAGQELFDHILMSLLIIEQPPIGSVALCRLWDFISSRRSFNVDMGLI